MLTRKLYRYLRYRSVMTHKPLFDHEVYEHLFERGLRDFDGIRLNDEGYILVDMKHPEVLMAYFARGLCRVWGSGLSLGTIVLIHKIVTLSTLAG